MMQLKSIDHKTLYKAFSMGVVVGTLPIGKVKAKYTTLMQVLGVPHETTEDVHSVSRVFWNFASNDMKYANRHVLAVYDYNQNVPVENVLEWNVSSRNLSWKEVVDYLRHRSDVHYRLDNDTLIITEK